MFFNMFLRLIHIIFYSTALHNAVSLFFQLPLNLGVCFNSRTHQIKMASFTSLSSTSPLCFKSLSIPHFSNQITLKPFPSKSKSLFYSDGFSLKAQTLGFSGSFFEGGFGSEEEPPSPPGTGFSAIEDKEEPQCPPGLRKYESMVVLRPDMSEDERLNLTQKYEELLVAGGGMYVEVFNRGVIPLAYSIKRKNKAGETNTYLDGIYLLFTYFTKPDSMGILEETLQTDDNVVRSMSFKACQVDLKGNNPIDNLPKIIFNEELRTRDSLCCVCLGEFEIKEELLQVPSCKHVFHIDCMNHWLISNSTCPLCRCSVIPSTRSSDPPQAAATAPPLPPLPDLTIISNQTAEMVSYSPRHPQLRQQEGSSHSIC